MFKLKLTVYDRFEVVYTVEDIGLNITGNVIDQDTVSYSFPEYSYIKTMDKGVDYTPVFKEQIPRYGEDIHTYFKGNGKDELEEILNKELKKEENQKLLLVMLFNRILVFNEE